MTRQNRVLPTGEIVANAARGLLMGNRGILHDEHGQLGRSRWRHPHWVCCRLAFRERKRIVMAPGHYTELFFLDEAVALSAGHRPCAECRRTDFETFRRVWTEAFGKTPSAPKMDQVLHRDRVRRNRTQVRHTESLSNLPEGSFVLLDGAAHLVQSGGVRRFSPSGYGPLRQIDPEPERCVLTPRATIEVLRSGYRAAVHPSAETCGPIDG